MVNDITVGNMQPPMRIQARRGQTGDIEVLITTGPVINADTGDAGMLVYNVMLIQDAHIYAMTPAGLANEVKRQLMRALKHELEEHLRYKGARVTDPHPEASR